MGKVEFFNGQTPEMERSKLMFFDRKEQFTNILTKPMGTRLFEQQRDNLGIPNKEANTLLRLRGSVEKGNLNGGGAHMNKAKPWSQSCSCHRQKGSIPPQHDINLSSNPQ